MHDDRIVAANVRRGLRIFTVGASFGCGSLTSRWFNHLRSLQVERSRESLVARRLTRVPLALIWAHWSLLAIRDITQGAETDGEKNNLIYHFEFSHSVQIRHWLRCRSALVHR